MNDEDDLVGKALADLDDAYAKVQSSSEDALYDALLDLSYFAGTAATFVRLGGLA